MPAAMSYKGVICSLLNVNVTDRFFYTTHDISLTAIRLFYPWSAMVLANSVNSVWFVKKCSIQTYLKAKYNY